MRCQAFIFARGGSKGVPRKNIRPLAGRPLIAYAIETALACPSLGDVIVSTDDEEIAEVARRYGARVPFMRPDDLAGDTSPEWLAWRHALDWAEADGGPLDAFVSLPATSPFRAVADVEACIDTLRSAPSADAVITVTASPANPFFNMVTLGEGNVANLAMAPGGAIARRQDAPVMFDITAVAYAVRPRHIRGAERLFDGEVRAVEVPAERALDIDTPHDFWLAELIAEARSSR
jgi:N-acylneuraminate cytidylyltransferase